ncbi:intradiol ring-cleavage dioxygenase [Actinomycetospora sp. TBRC 11914]|uniref:intradiol ring-cleavage dioxygenase n=1 Tax=Actinomycetospora sp. TBRC 11914 TaxID=2729387 RepID=UPI00145FCE8F|nr:intradiol ring-cleavage dioxygenase [Actinomycetospora sp. TBRC 11914]NMO91709.1 intradiol ring-cleavage dioxygenase [Actinomycetospora sp. TBRC 11914]
MATEVGRSAAPPGIPLDRFPAAPTGPSVEQIEGPYYIGGEGDRLTRSDVREGKDGVPLDLGVRVVSGADGRPVPDVAVDLWHCDALGVYSGYDNDPDELLPNGARQDPRTDDRFLRGTQLTDADGVVRFRSIFPGWYSPRTPHLHLRLRAGDRPVHTTQLYFPERVIAWVATQEPYRQRADRRAATNDDDFVIGVAGGPSDAWARTERVRDGLVATATLAVDVTTDAVEFALDDPPPEVVGPPPGFGVRHGFAHPADRA